MRVQRKSHLGWVQILLLTSGSILLAAFADAQVSIEVLHVFPPGPGRHPARRLTQATDGNLYGVAGGGGPGWGTIFKMTSGGAYTLLHALEFNERDASGLTEGRDGNFYGTTVQGGQADRGTVFRMTPDGTVTRLHSFLGGQDGSVPVAGVIQGRDGSFYGTTFGGGQFGGGTVFKMTPDGIVTVLHAFAGGSGDGLAPESGLIQATDGSFYGTTFFGGMFNRGTVFRMTPAGQLTLMYSFPSGGVDTPRPRGLIQATDGNFYGTTVFGGSSDRGTIFRITSAGAFAILHSFDGSDGSFPFELVQAGDGYVYGITQRDGAYCDPPQGCGGTIFRMTTGGAVTVLHSFGSGDGDGNAPLAPMVVGSNGNLFGTTFTGGRTFGGTIFTMTLTGMFDVVYSFPLGSAEGNAPWVAPIQAVDGNFYGTTHDGGEAGRGTLYQMTPAGATRVLHTFGLNGSDGSIPDGTLIQASDGNLYGSTLHGGEFDGGTVFTMDPTGTLTSFYTFEATGDGQSPRAIIQATDGAFYGAASGGLALGTLFRLSPDGEFDLLHTFNEDAKGSEPSALLEAADRNFYGTTQVGGLGNFGTVFQLTPDGTDAVRYSFLGQADGSFPSPRTALVQGADGALYGTCQNGGAFDAGTIFKITPDGVFTLLHTFNGRDGSVPWGVILGRDGNFYGTTQYGGAADSGTIFQITPGGTLTVLYEFGGGVAGGTPLSGLYQARDGAFYGTSPSGGRTAQGLGTGFVFRFRLP